MNSLSWLVYAADVAGNVGVVLVLGSLLGILGMFIASMVAGHQTDFGRGEPGDWKRPWRHVWIVAVALLVASAIPSKTTIYMIAASEIGETVVTSPDAVEMMNDLRTIVRGKLKELAE